MENSLQHDPRTKQQIKDALFDFLYSPIKNQFNVRLETLIVRNCLVQGYGHKSFTYKGELYATDPHPLPRPANRLAPQLVPPMEDYLRDLKTINEHEIPYVLGFINQVLNASNTLTDYLRLLPESVHYPIQQYIATCPCQAKQLPNEQVRDIQEKNQTSIELMKRRMVINLLL